VKILSAQSVIPSRQSPMKPCGCFSVKKRYRVRIVPKMAAKVERLVDREKTESR
jgi:hypothetical protein